MSSDISTIRTQLKRAGLRCTSSRISVLQQLHAASAPMTHADVADSLAKSGVDKATVFRNLVDLTDAGLLLRTELGHVWRFEIRDESRDDSHPHFLCLECGAVTCLGEMKFTEASLERSAQIGRITEISVKGHCVKCMGRN